MCGSQVKLTAHSEAGFVNVDSGDGDIDTTLIEDNRIIDISLHMSPSVRSGIPISYTYDFPVCHTPFDYRLNSYVCGTILCQKHIVRTASLLIVITTYWEALHRATQYPSTRPIISRILSCLYEFS